MWIQFTIKWMRICTESCQSVSTTSHAVETASCSSFFSALLDVFFFTPSLHSPSPILNILKNERSIFYLCILIQNFVHRLWSNAKRNSSKKKFQSSSIFASSFKFIFPRTEGVSNFKRNSFRTFFFLFFFVFFPEKKNIPRKVRMSRWQERDGQVKNWKKKKKRKSNEKVDVATFPLSFNQLRNTIERKVYVWWSVCPWMYLWCLC